MKIKLCLYVFLTFFVFASCVNNSKKNNLSKTPDSEVAWKLVWSDEFNGDSVNSNNWTYQVEQAGRFNDEWQRYTSSPKNAYVENGNLVIKAIHESDTFGMDHFTSARLHTANKHTWKYGKVSARIRLPKGNGMWPAFWMLGANIDENGGNTPWPETGEIDILEFYGSKDSAVVEANIHYADKNNAHKMMGAKKFLLENGSFEDNFHVFELIWDAQQLTWFVDGNQYASASIVGDEFTEFHQPFFILLNLAVGGKNSGRPDATTGFPKHMYVDWVRVYQQ